MEEYGICVAEIPAEEKEIAERLGKTVENAFWGCWRWIRLDLSPQNLYSVGMSLLNFKLR